MNKVTGKTVLCISDDPVGLNLRCGLLQDHGWRVLTAATGHEGVRRCQREAVDIVVLELNEAEAEAAVIASELKRLHPSMPLIMLAPCACSLLPHLTAQADFVVRESKNPTELLAALRKTMGIS